MYALADCNNFFASCERVFRPELNGRPVIVLSNNDGCAVARSNEAKALGVKMGDPYFKLKPLIEANGIAVFSSNFALYGDMSRRVQEVLRTYSPAVEPYSIDECFLDLSGMEKFQQRNGATQCKLLKGIGTGKPLRDCPDCVADASEFLEEYLSD